MAALVEQTAAVQCQSCHSEHEDHADGDEDRNDALPFRRSANEAGHGTRPFFIKVNK
jgi:hypothetical protein